MHRLLGILFFVSGTCFAQAPQLELHSYGFDPVEVAIPATPVEKLLEVSKGWALEYNREERGADITNVTTNSMDITAYKRNAFYYRNRGFTQDHSITYTMHLTFTPNSYTLTFKVNDIYVDGDSLIEYKLPDYFTSSGSLKEGYTSLDESLEATVNKIIESHYNFIISYR